tara:strand:+ start:1133 stop:2152 length:1020 start_codon:yes stop_codon:yes gene_type:complete
MANQNIRTPRFYTDISAYLLSRGMTQDGNLDVKPTGSGFMGTFVTGSEAELFDLRPLNKVTFNTSSATSDHVMVNINTSTFKKNFVAILNHNMKTANAKVHIRTNDTLTNVDDVDLGSGTVLANPVEVMNADSISSSIIEPATDGHTIITFDETDDRYFGIQFEGASAFDGSDNLFVGCILVGEYYDMPHAPDLNLTRSIEFDKVIQSESLGGQRYSTMVNYGRESTTTTKSPFNTESYSNKTYGGRMSFNMNFSYLASTDIMPNEMDASNLSDDAIIEDVWNRTNGKHLPFIFSVDNTSTGNNSEADHIFARFDQDSLSMKQVALDTFNINLKITEEF